MRSHIQHGIFINEHRNLSSFFSFKKDKIGENKNENQLNHRSNRFLLLSYCYLYLSIHNFLWVVENFIYVWVFFEYLSFWHHLLLKIFMYLTIHYSLSMYFYLIIDYLLIFLCCLAFYWNPLLWYFYFNMYNIKNNILLNSQTIIVQSPDYLQYYLNDLGLEHKSDYVITKKGTK